MWGTSVPDLEFMSLTEITTHVNFRKRVDCPDQTAINQLSSVSVSFTWTGQKVFVQMRMLRLCLHLARSPESHSFSITYNCFSWSRFL